MTVAEFVYSVVLKPRPLRAAANATLRALVPRSIERHGATIVLNPDDPVVSGALALNVYERPETRFFLSVCRPGMVVLDVGANVGYYTALALRHIGRDARVVALEPDQETYSYLLRTVEANGGTNTTCVCKAAAAANASMQLYSNPDNRGDSRLYENKLATRSAAVEAITIDSLLESLGIASVNLIKIDVQGFEANVFAGLEQTIRRSPDLTIMSEFWPYGLRSAGSDPLELLNRLEGFGLVLQELSPNGSLTAVRDKQALIDSYPGRQYTSIIAMRRSGATANSSPSVALDDE
jgi:FkbM family methyltransferase